MKRKRILIHLVALGAAGLVLASGFARWQQNLAIAKAMPLTTVSSMAPPAKIPVTLEVAQTLSNYELRAGYPQPTKDLLQKAVYSETHGDRPALGRILRKMAASYKDADAPEIAVTLGKQAVKLEEKSGRFLQVAQNLQDIALIYEQAGNLDESVHFQQAAAGALRSRKYDIPLAALLQHLSATFQKMGKYGDAKITLAKAKKVIAHHQQHLLASRHKPTNRSSNRIASASLPRRFAGGAKPNIPPTVSTPQDDNTAPEQLAETPDLSVSDSMNP